VGGHRPAHPNPAGRRDQGRHRPAARRAGHLRPPRGARLPRTAAPRRFKRRLRAARPQLRSVAIAALEGRLDASRLRALPPEQALAELRQLPGIGDFSAELILLRGAAAPDELPRHEPRLARAVALAYNLPGPPSAQELQHISGNWRPYRTWATVLLRTFLEDQTHEIAGQPAVPARPAPPRG